MSVMTMSNSMMQRVRTFLNAMRRGISTDAADTARVATESLNSFKAAIADLKELVALQSTSEAKARLADKIANLEALFLAQQQELYESVGRIEALERDRKKRPTDNLDRQRYQLVQTPFGSVVYALTEHEQSTQKRLYFCEKCFNRGRISPLQPTTSIVRSRATEKLYVERRCEVCTKRYGCEAQELSPRR